MNRRSHAHGLCGPGCGYKPLYEGSQSSLSDMAGKQAAALTRVARLRQGIILELKQAFPVEFADAERQAAKRMSDFDDEVLLAYLAGFLAMPKAQTAIRSAFATVAPGDPSVEVEHLRGELAAAGIAVPANTDLSAWADAVRAWAAAKAPPQVSAVPPTQPGKAPDVTVSEARLDPPHSPGVPPNVPPAPPGSPVQTPFGLPAHPTERPRPTTRKGSAVDFADAAAAAGATADIKAPVARKKPGAPGPQRRSTATSSGSGLPADGGAAPGESAPWDLLFSDEPGDSGLAPLDSPFTEGPGVFDAPLPPEPQWAPAHDGDDDLLSGLFDDPAPEPEGDSLEPPAAIAAEPELTTAPPPIQKPASAVAAEEPSEAGAVVAATPVATPPPVVEAAAPDPGAAVNTRTSGPIKPIAPGGAPASVRPVARAAKKSAAPKARGRKPRVSAAGPGGSSDPIEALTQAASGAGGAITDELRDKFLAVVCMPRPVFVSDLVEMVGDADLVAAWEAEYRALGASGPLRFIAAKQRHKARGALILPFSEELRTASAGFEKSLWARCINAPTLKGAKLYELAVLLHRVIDQVLTFDIGTLAVTMRINQQRGLVGVVLVLDPETGAGSQARVELGESMEALAESRLSLLAICTYAGGPRCVPDLAQSAREEIDARNIDPTFPVIAQTSWSFASDGGTSAVSVL